MEIGILIKFARRGIHGGLCVFNGQRSFTTQEGE